MGRQFQRNRRAQRSSVTAGLNDKFTPGSPIRVDYLPQSLIEKVCSADPNSQTKQELEAEIERVVFRHIDDVSRGSATSLTQLLQAQGVTHQATLKEARAKIAESAASLSALQRRRAELEALDLPGRKEVLESRLHEVNAELQTVTSEIDSGGTPEQQAQSAELRAARVKRQHVTSAIEELRLRRDAITVDVAEVSALRARLQSANADAQSLADDVGGRIGVASDSLLEVTFEASVIDSWVTARMGERATHEQSQTQSGGLDDQLAVASRAVEEQQAALQSLNEDAQVLLTRQAESSRTGRRLAGRARRVGQYPRR